mgnify:CR=1 FL=1
MVKHGWDLYELKLSRQSENKGILPLLLCLQALTKSAFEMQQLLHGHNQSQYIAATFSCQSFALLYTDLKAQLP